MLVPPEMGMEDEMPVDTYDNIPEDEKEAAEASQLPDDEMEEDYTGYVLRAVSRRRRTRIFNGRSRN